MAKATKKNYYAVRHGRDGPMIYRDWPQCEHAVSGFPNAKFKGFQSLAEAESYLNTAPNVTHTIQRVQLPSSPTGMPGSFTEDCEPGPFGDNAGFIPLPKSPVLTASSSKQGGQGSESPTPQVELSSQQRTVLQRVESGKSVFFTGSAGTGKSVLLRAIIDSLGGRSASFESGVAITASTGIAAVNIGGTTLHSFTGIGLGKEKVERLTGKISGQKYLRKRWRELRTLIIDEISMIDGELFDKLETIARMVRDIDQPFGGIQLVVSGDFCQLPPVPDKLDGFQIPVKFAFEARSWKSCVGPPITLTKVFRQRDEKFVDILNNMRYGNLDDRSAAKLVALSRPITYNDGIEPTELFPLRWEVETANAQRLASLPGSTHTYTAQDSAPDYNGNKISFPQMQKLLDRLVAVREVTLKVGAQVMLVKNMVQGHLVNGSLGQVIDFKNVNEARRAGVEVAKVDNTQPGDNVVPRNKSPEPQDDPDLVKSSNGVAGVKDTRVWPIVRFTNGRVLICIPVKFSAVNARGDEEANRDQIPLILAWALSVHKSQGQTIERVKVNLARTFEKGQAYVALSRATNMDTLQVLNFDRRKVQAHPRVLQWYKMLEDEEKQALARELEDPEALQAFFED